MVVCTTNCSRSTAQHNVRLGPLTQSLADDKRIRMLSMVPLKAKREKVSIINVCQVLTWNMYARPLQVPLQVCNDQQLLVNRKPANDCLQHRSDCNMDLSDEAAIVNISENTH